METYLVATIRLCLRSLFEEYITNSHSSDRGYVTGWLRNLNLSQKKRTMVQEYIIDKLKDTEQEETWPEDYSNDPIAYFHKIIDDCQTANEKIVDDNNRNNDSSNTNDKGSIALYIKAAKSTIDDASNIFKNFQNITTEQVKNNFGIRLAADLYTYLLTNRIAETYQTLFVSSTAASFFKDPNVKIQKETRVMQLLSRIISIEKEHNQENLQYWQSYFESLAAKLYQINKLSSSIYKALGYISISTHVLSFKPIKLNNLFSTGELDKLIKTKLDEAENNYNEKNYNKSLQSNNDCNFDALIANKESKQKQSSTVAAQSFLSGNSASNRKNKKTKVNNNNNIHTQKIK